MDFTHQYSSLAEREDFASFEGNFRLQAIFLPYLQGLVVLLGPNFGGTTELTANFELSEQFGILAAER